MIEIKGGSSHQLIIKENKPQLSFNENNDYKVWKQQIKDKWLELIGIDKLKQNACPLNVQIEKVELKDGYTQTRFVFESERGEFVPCYLLVPTTGKEKYPVAITLQGHSSGFHNSIAEPKNEKEKEYALGRGKFAVQAVEQGYAALAIEQRGLGERWPSEIHQREAHVCEYISHIAFMLGRTVIGERVWDVSRAIDALSEFEHLDLNDIFITGNSGGGTASYYAACYDDRIKFSAPSCAFCPYPESIMNWYHCSCNFIPHAYEWFDMQDLACLIAPKKLLIVAGELDNIFPINGVDRGYETVKKIFNKEGVKDNCRLVKTPKAHWWCEDIIWKEIAKMRNQ